MDRVARWLVSAGGIAIIASILGILIFILLEVLPLTSSAKVEPARRLAVPGAGRIEALLADEHRTHVAILDERGQARVVRLEDGQVVYSSDIVATATAPRSPEEGEPAAATPPAGGVTLTGSQVPPQRRAFAAATSDGRVLIKRMAFEVSFEGNRRVITPDTQAPVSLRLDPAGRPLGAFAAQLDTEGGSATAAAVLESGRIAVVRRGVEENAITGESTESISRGEAAAPGRITAMVIDPDQRNLFAGTAAGDLLWWTLRDGQPGELRTVSAGAPVTALNLLLGGRSLAVGQESGALSVWFAVRETDDDASARLTRIHDFPALPGTVLGIVPSQRDKGFLALGGGRMGLYFSTSERTLWTGAVPLENAASLAYAPKADGAFVGGAGQVAALDIRNPHPEVTWKSLFGKVWYEGAEKPEFVWQSSGASDDFEPKLSLTPLLVGTLKGTFYSMLLAIPLGVLGAMYTSQFMHPTYKRYLKPMIEIMASLPSVVLGFLAGLWLAPRIEKAVPALALMLLLLPLFVLLAGYLWNRLPRTFLGRFHVGTEAILFVFVLAAGIWFCFQMSQPFERLVFGGNFQAWLLQATGLGYDQRNAVVVGLAMGFAVIPIIFAIAEDAFSNVPRNLVAGSLALGADRWQTVTRIIIPASLPSCARIRPNSRGRSCARSLGR